MKKSKWQEYVEFHYGQPLGVDGGDLNVRYFENGKTLILNYDAPQTEDDE